MKYVIALLCGAAMFVYTTTSLSADAPPSKARVEVITFDGGGRVRDYVKRSRDWDDDGVEVQIKGPCLSACTLYLSMKNVCVWPTATLAWHAPYAVRGRSKIYDEDQTKYFMSLLPFNIQSFIKVNGGLAPTFLYAYGPLLNGLVRICK